MKTIDEWTLELAYVARNDNSERFREDAKRVLTEFSREARAEEKEACAKRGFDATLGCLDGPVNYTHLQVAAQVAAAIRSSKTGEK